MNLKDAKDSTQLVEEAFANGHYDLSDMLIEDFGIVIKPEVKQDGGSGIAPPGYRHIYIEECIDDNDPTLWEVVDGDLSSWAIIAVKNGTLHGYGYGGKIVNDGGKRNAEGNVTYMYVNAIYPVNAKVREIYKNKAKEQ